jgi:hypothetical protein
MLFRKRNRSGKRKRKRKRKRKYLVKSPDIVDLGTSVFLWQRFGKLVLPHLMADV